MSNSVYLARLLSEQYGKVKTTHPAEGRRKLRLRVADLFWNLSPQAKDEYFASTSQDNPLPQRAADEADFSTDDDPFDELSDNAPGIGILLRTDYANEDAWQAFYSRLQEAEAEFKPVAAQAQDDPMTDAAAPGGPSTVSEATEAPMDEDDESEDDEAAEKDAPILFVINPTAPERRAVFAGISNLAALRLLNDVDVRRAPVPPAGTRRVKPPHRLVDRDGWQEVYTGKQVWIYDARSNADMCARLVSQQGAAMYGTATGDSWRARVGNVCELAVNLAAGAMTIDFGGMDRWDHAERVRNLAEAEPGPTVTAIS